MTEAIEEFLDRLVREGKIMRVEDVPVPEKRRFVSKQARNVQHGDLMEFPGFDGLYEVNGWGHHTKDKIVIISSIEGYQVTLPEKERVRVSRVVNAS